jgi:hypothetical protein
MNSGSERIGKEEIKNRTEMDELRTTMMKEEGDPEGRVVENSFRVHFKKKIIF